MKRARVPPYLRCEPALRGLWEPTLSAIFPFGRQRKIAAEAAPTSAAVAALLRGFGFLAALLPDQGYLAGVFDGFHDGLHVIRGRLVTCISTREYIELVDATGRRWHPAKRGRITGRPPAVLGQLGIDADQWENRVHA